MVVSTRLKGETKMVSGDMIRGTLGVSLGEIREDV